ncbi:MAG: hypothetical protein ACJAZ9_000884 [Neolewinella sp.]
MNVTRLPFPNQGLDLIIDDLMVVVEDNLKNDPFEQFDMAMEFPEEVARLRGVMEGMADETGANMAILLTNNTAN